MILLFLGDWRPTVVISISIPLSIFVSIILLGMIGQTINIMTLGGLALAVGILVDDATVEIENIERNLAMGKEMKQAILDGAQQIAVPAFVSTLCICIVFVPMFFLTGVARYLFVPLAEAVSFAMLASYFLSRTLIPTLVMYIMRGHEHRAEAPRSAPGPVPARLRAQVRGVPPRLRAAAGDHHRAPRPLRAVLPGLLRPFPGPVLLPRAGLLPAGGRRPAAPARARPPRPAGGGDRAALRPGGSRAAGGDPQGAAGDDPGQHRPAQFRHQPVLQHQRHHRHAPTPRSSSPWTRSTTRPPPT